MDMYALMVGKVANKQWFTRACTQVIKHQYHTVFIALKQCLTARKEKRRIRER